MTPKAHLSVSHIHVLDAGVNPEHFRLSMEAGTAYSNIRAGDEDHLALL